MPPPVVVAPPWLPVALATLALLGCSREAPVKPAPPNAPNVLLITLDGLRQDHLSFSGYPRATSPNIDALAERGMVFDEVVPSSCSTKISLTSLFTSLDYPRHAVADHKDLLPDEALTLAEVFAANGYATGGVVASAWLSESLNFDQGFEFYEDFHGRKERGVRADMVVGEAVRFLRERAREGEEDPRPFFLYLHTHEPHPPWWGGSPWDDGPSTAREDTRFYGEWCGYVPTDEQRDALALDRQQKLVARYDGAIHFADAWIGALIATLQHQDRLRNTIVAISADHGMGLTDHFSAGHGNTPFDEVTRGFLVLYDGRDPRASAAPELQGRIFDIGPTLIGRAGLELPPQLDGVDLLRDAGRLPEYAYSTCFSGDLARSRTHKLIRFDPGLRELYGRWPRGVPGEWMLVDLGADPGETRDVSAEQPEVRARMQRALLEHGPGTESHDLEPEAREAIDPKSLERLRELGYVE
jgi:arylsulfatase A-like enzyme